MDVFFACFADLEDPRDDNARHDLLELLVIALCAVLCGAEDCSDMALFGRAKEAFFREFLTLRHGVPSHDTFSRVFRLIDPVKFHACFLVFMRIEELLLALGLHPKAHGIERGHNVPLL